MSGAPDHMCVHAINLLQTGGMRTDTDCYFYSEPPFVHYSISESHSSIFNLSNVCEISIYVSFFFLSLSNIQSKGLIAVDDKSKPPHSCSHAIFIILIITNNP